MKLVTDLDPDAPEHLRYYTVDDDTYDADCDQDGFFSNSLVGRGRTPEESEADFWSQLND